MAKPIPEGFHTITPHLVIKGADEAIAFYEKVFGADEIYRMHMPAEDGGMKIGHAELKFGDSVLFLADEFPGQGVTAPDGHSPVIIHLYVSDVDTVFDRAIDAGSTAQMAPADMFWGDRYAKLVDPFGHHWALATHIEDVTPDQMQERMAAMFSKQPCESQ